MSKILDSVISGLAGLFRDKGGDVTAQDLIASIKVKYPQLTQTPDEDIAAKLSTKDQFSFLKEYKPDSPVPPDLVPIKLRTPKFYEKYPDLSHADAMKIVKDAQVKYPTFYNGKSTEEVAADIETRIPEMSGLSARIKPPQPPKTNAVVKFAADTVKAIPDPVEAIGKGLLAPAKASIEVAKAEGPSQDRVIDAGRQSLKWMRTNGEALENTLIKKTLKMDSPEFVKQPIAAGVVEMAGFFKGLTGADLKIDPESLKLLQEKKINPNIADAAGQMVGGLAYYATIARVIGAHKLSAKIAESMISNLTVARYVAPAAADAATFATGDAIREGVRQVVDGEMDVKQLGEVILHGGQSGLLLGSTRGLPNGIARVAGQTAVGATFGLQNSNPEDSPETMAKNMAISAGVFGLFGLSSERGMTEAQRMGTYRGLRNSIRNATQKSASEYALKNGYTPEESVSMGESIGGKVDGLFDTFAKKYGGAKKIPVSEMEKFSGEFKGKVDGLIKNHIQVKVPPENLRIPKTEIAPAGPSEVPPTEQPIVPSKRIFDPETVLSEFNSPISESLKDLNLAKEKGMSEGSYLTARKAVEKSILSKWGIINKPFMDEASRKTDQKKILEETPLIHLDIDNLKKLNEKLGHVGADRLIGESLKLAREYGFYPVRVGGDEFVFVINPHGEKSDPYEVMDRFAKFNEAANKLVVSDLAGNSHSGITFSAGFGVGEEAADKMAIKAKQSGKAQVLMSKDFIQRYNKSEETSYEWKPIQSTAQDSDHIGRRVGETLPAAPADQAGVKMGDQTGRESPEPIRPDDRSRPAGEITAEAPTQTTPPETQEAVQETPAPKNPEEISGKIKESEPVTDIGVQKIEESTPTGSAKEYASLKIEDGSLKDIKGQVVSGLKDLSKANPIEGIYSQEQIKKALLLMVLKKNTHGISSEIVDKFKKTKVGDKPIKIDIPGDGTFIIKPTKYAVEQAIRIFDKANPSIFSPIEGKSGEGHHYPGGAPISLPFDKKPIEKNISTPKRRSPRSGGQKSPSAGSRSIDTFEREINKPFFSSLQRIMEERLPNQSTPEQVRNIASSAKKEEVEWSGLDQFLEGKQTVSKSELLDFLRQNEVQVQEVMKGGKEIPTSAEDLAMRRYGKTWLELTDAQRQEINKDYRESPTPKFSSYTLPGGENYRELLLTLPVERYEGAIYSIRKTPNGKFDVYKKSDNSFIAEYSSLAEAQDAVLDWDKRPLPFRSSHFDEPNVLAHVRMNDRVDAEGKKVLFIEEIQSDWHQKGRKEGYTKQLTELPQGYEVQSSAIVGDKTWFLSNPFTAGRVNLGVHADENAATKAAIKELNQQNAERAVPDAPFKKTWHELALKRILRYAAENGYDRIAWTTGEQQAERYNLSKYVNEVRAHVYPKTFGEPEGPKRISLDINPKEGKRITKIVDENELSDMVGKDLAEKIMNQSVDNSVSKSGPITTYSGLDLKVGGEGMKGFYDQIVPSFLNKYAKKWGGRVGETEIEGKKNPNLKIVNAGQNGYYIRDTETDRDLANTNTMQEAQRELIRLSGNTPVHSLDITPSMKSEVLTKGQPLFQKKGKRSSPGPQPVDTFEKNVPESKLEQQSPEAFKLAEAMKEIVKKYAGMVGERYVPRNAAGVYYPDTDNIRLLALNDISSSAHEITHYLDNHNDIIKKLITPIKYTSKGYPVYDSKTLDIRKALTDVYVKFYAEANEDDKLQERMTEGYATFIQKIIEQPKFMSEKYPQLVKDILMPGGRLYHKIIPDFIRDMRGLIKKYQELDPLEKIGARMTDKFKQNEVKSEFLNWKEKFITQLVDELYPIEKLGKLAGKERTEHDPSLWIRLFNNSSSIVLQNIKGERGFRIYSNGEFKQVSDRTIGDFVKELETKGLAEDFGKWLIARRIHFDYLKLDEMEGPAKEAEEFLLDLKFGKIDRMTVTKTEIREAIEKVRAFRRFKRVLSTDAFDRNNAMEAYNSHLERFKKYEKVYDDYNAFDLSMMADPTIGLITPNQYETYSTQKGYTSFKRDVYDELIGSGEEHLPQPRVGKTKVSSTIGRKGSQLDIVNPIHSLVRDHAEIMRKVLKQAIYNRIAGIAKEFPGLFQRIDLKVAKDPKSGALSYPQEKDPNIMMSRSGAGRRVPYLVSKEVKEVIDGALTYQNIHAFEIFMRSANRMFTKGTTGAYPLFAPTNLVIDQITATAQTRNKYLPLYDGLSVLSKAIMGRDTPEHRFMQEYLFLGGERQTFVHWQDLPPDELFKTLSNEKTKLEQFSDQIDKGFDILALPSSGSEIFSRATEYIKSRMNGNPQVVALEDAGRVTAPFHHVGKWGGGTVGKTAIRSIPFFNAAIQVLAQNWRSVFSTQTRDRALFVIGILNALAVGASFYLMKGGSEEQKKLYSELYPGELANYIWLPSRDNKNLVRIRVPEAMIVPATMLNMALADQILNAKYTAMDYVDGATAFLPDQLNPTDPIRAFFSLIPQLIKPLALVAAGVRDYPKIRPLESRSLESAEPRYRFYENTSNFSKWLGNKLNLSPIKIDYLLEGYMGRVTGLFTGKAIKNPFVREWYFTAGRNLQDYYEIKDAAEQKFKAIKEGSRKFSDEEINNTMTRLGKVKAIEKQIKVYRAIDKEIKDGKIKDIRYVEKLRTDILDGISELK